MENNRYKLDNPFTHNRKEVEEYMNKVYVNSINYYHTHYYNHPELTDNFDQDAKALFHSFRFLEDYLFYYDQFYPNSFDSIFHNLQNKLDIITVLPLKKRRIYGEFKSDQKTVFIRPNFEASASLTGLERTRLYMCHELGHIINSDWMNCVERHIRKSNETGEILQLMYDGFSLLDESTTQNRAEAITYYFSKKQRGSLAGYRGRLFDGETYRSNFDYYGEFQEPAISFSKTLRGNGGASTNDDDAMRLLSIRTLDGRFVDKVFNEYEKDGHLSDLYTMMAFLGIIKNASYAVFGYEDKKYISESKLAKDEFMKMAKPLFDSRLPYQF